MELVSLQGVALRGGFVASRVELGSLAVEGQKFLIAPREEMARVGRGVDGVLGQAFLSQVDYQLDWKHRALTLGGEVTAGARVPFEISHGRMLVTTSRGRLVLDSGADAVVLRGRTAGEIDSRLDTVTGSLDVKTAEVDIAIGKRLFRDLLAAFVPGAKQDPSEPDGLLPMSLFESIYVSNSGGYVVFGR
jgi:hypothetical protein